MMWYEFDICLQQEVDGMRGKKIFACEEKKEILIFVCVKFSNIYYILSFHKYKSTDIWCKFINQM